MTNEAAERADRACLHPYFRSGVQGSCLANNEQHEELFQSKQIFATFGSS